MTSIALFDLDKTLVRKDTAGLFIRYEYDLGRVSLARVARVAGWRLRYTLGTLRANEVARRALSWYTGRDVGELAREIPGWFDTYVRPHISDAARRAVERHQRAGDLVVIATSGTVYSAQPLMQHLGIEHLVCSELEVVDGRLTGRAIEPLCYGDGKLRRVRRFLQDKLGSDELTDATAYSDSVTDLPLLSAVSTPVAVNPDPRLRAIAARRGWRVEFW